MNDVRTYKDGGKVFDCASCDWDHENIIFKEEHDDGLMINSYVCPMTQKKVIVAISGMDEE